MREPALLVDSTALGHAADEMRRCNQMLADARAPIAGIGRRAISGAGQLGGSLDAGVATFVLSWQAALDVFAASASSIATLTGHAADVYTATDLAVAAAMTGS